jgi:hypothetical protein
LQVLQGSGLPEFTHATQIVLFICASLREIDHPQAEENDIDRSVFEAK